MMRGIPRETLTTTFATMWTMLLATTRAATCATMVATMWTMLLAATCNAFCDRPHHGEANAALRW